jgi:hypothetical protein
MQLFDLPDELLDLCCYHIDRSKSQLNADEEDTSAQDNSEAHQNLRLTCKRISPVATKHLFSRLHLLPTKDSALKARAVLDDEHLNLLVTTIYTQASLFDDRISGNVSPPSWEFHPDDYSEGETDENDEEHGIVVDGELSATFKRTLDDIGLFRNLRRVELVYDHQVQGPSADERSYGGEVKESTEYRAAFFCKLVSALNHPGHPACRLNSLSILNLQDWVSADIASCSDFLAVLSRLEQVELCIASEQDEPDPHSEIWIPERHRFYFEQLREHWLQPLQESGRLTGLKLYGSIPWGYLPKCDLRGLNFPKLRSLSLGNMNFTHDWQLEWTLSHGSTLVFLTLHQCSIIPDTEMVHTVDGDNYPILPRVQPPTGRGRSIESTWSYAARWHDYFDRFRTELHHLLHFAINHGTWILSYNGPSDAAKLFNTAENLPAEIGIRRYNMMTG